MAGRYDAKKASQRLKNLKVEVDDKIKTIKENI